MMCYLSLNLYAIDFKTWHYAPLVLTFKIIPSYSSGFIQDLLNHYVWIDVGSMMYMSGEAPFIGFLTNR